jgi:hypothetical protein
MEQPRATGGKKMARGALRLFSSTFFSLYLRRRQRRKKSPNPTLPRPGPPKWRKRRREVVVEEEKRNNLPEARTHVHKKSRRGLREKSVETLGSVARRTRSLSDRFLRIFYFYFRLLWLFTFVRSFWSFWITSGLVWKFVFDLVNGLPLMSWFREVIVCVCCFSGVVVEGCCVCLLLQQLGVFFSRQRRTPSILFVRQNFGIFSLPYRVRLCCAVCVCVWLHFPEDW